MMKAWTLESKTEERVEHEGSRVAAAGRYPAAEEGVESGRGGTPLRREPRSCQKMVGPVQGWRHSQGEGAAGARPQAAHPAKDTARGASQDATHVARTWATCGVTPILRYGQRDRIVASAISAVTWRPWARQSGHRPYGLYLQLRRHAVCSRDAIGFVRHLLRHVHRPIGLVWDRLGAHTSATTWRFLIKCPCITVHHLPPYRPELNPDDYVWGHLKSPQLANLYPENRGLRAHLHRAVRRIRSRPRLLASFLHAASLA
jgi:transposase